MGGRFVCSSPGDYCRRLRASRGSRRAKRHSSPGRPACPPGLRRCGGGLWLARGWRRSVARVLPPVAGGLSLPRGCQRPHYMSAQRAARPHKFKTAGNNQRYCSWTRSLAQHGGHILQGGVCLPLRHDHGWAAAPAHAGCSSAAVAAPAASMPPIACRCGTASG